jgi:central glycolytic genes regulator
VLDIQKQLLPDLMDTMRKRYTILHHIMLSRVIGRRTLASTLDMTERVLRSEIDFLKAQGLLEIESFGMRVSVSGEQLLQAIEPMVRELFGLSELEDKLRARFGMDSAVVVPGDSDTSPFAKIELGRAGAAAVRKMAAKEGVVAVTGGSTMAEVANHISPTPQLKSSLFVPARGGLGESVDFQANTIASTMAKKCGGQYRLLHVPDHLGEEAYLSLIQEPNIQEIIGVIGQTRMLVHGIGEASLMAKRRKIDSGTIEQLKQEGAVAEAFGYYFDASGTMIHKMPTVGLKLEDIQKTEVVIAVAGGKSKARSIAAVMRFGCDHVLVTDEAAALEMLES